MLDNEIVTQPRGERLRTRVVGPSERPQFSLRVVFGLVTFTAVHIAVVRAFSESEVGAWGFTYLLLQAAVWSMSFVATVILLQRWYSRATWTIEPGHWLMLAIAVAATGQIAIEAINYSLPRRIISTSGFSVVLTSACLVLPLLSKRFGFIWRCGFVGLLAIALTAVSATELLENANTIRRALAYTAPLPTLILLAVPCWFDSDRRERSWLHWTGILIWFLAKSAPGLLEQCGELFS